MRPYMVIPSYWSGPNTKHNDGDSVFDHPTPLNEEGTLRRTLDSISILEDKNFTLIVIGVATNPKYDEEVHNRLENIIKEADLKIDTILFTNKNLEKLKTSLFKDRDPDDILSIDNYSNIRNMCIFLPYILDAEVAILIDDDEVFEDPAFVNKAKEFIGRRFYGNTVDGVAGYYLNEDGEYYDKVNIVPWMTYWDRFGGKREAFDQIIGSDPRLKKTPFAFGGAMVIHRNLMRIVPFDPKITRGEDTDYVINARMFGFNFYLDNTLAIKHLPPPKKHPVWKRFREDIYRFLYDKSKFDTQSPQTNLRMITPEEFDPYPGEFMKQDLGDKIFKTNIILALNYLADGDIEACKETINNIYLARYEAVPHNNTFDAYLDFQRKWRKLLEYTRDFGNTLKNIILEGMVITFDKYQYEVKKIKEKARGLDNFNIDDIELFKGFSKKELRRLFFIAEIKNYAKDEYIFHDDEVDTNIYIVLRGKLLVTKKQDSTGEYITIAKLEQGEHFNETSIFTERVHRVSVITTTEVDLMILTKEKAQAILKEDCALSAKIYRILAKKLSERLVITTQKFSETKEKTTDISDSMQNK